MMPFSQPGMGMQMPNMQAPPPTMQPMNMGFQGAGMPMMRPMGQMGMQTNMQAQPMMQQNPLQVNPNMFTGANGCIVLISSSFVSDVNLHVVVSMRLSPVAGTTPNPRMNFFNQNTTMSTSSHGAPLSEEEFYRLQRIEKEERR